MEDRRFDELTRALIATRSRRALTRIVTAGALGALGAPLLTRLGREAVAARCVTLNRKCVKDGKKQKCCGGAKCKGTKCRCIGGRKPCGKLCCAPDLICGDPATQTCVIGAATCQAGDDVCAGTSVPCGNAVCSCYVSATGARRCGQDAGGDHDECATSDAECFALYGAGAFCIDAGGPGPSPCGGSLGNFCGKPCPS